MHRNLHTLPIVFVDTAESEKDEVEIETDDHGNLVTFNFTQISWTTFMKITGFY